MKKKTVKKDALAISGLEALALGEQKAANGGWGGFNYGQFQASWAWQDTSGGTHWGAIPYGASGTQYAVATDGWGRQLSYYT